MPEPASAQIGSEYYNQSLSLSLPDFGDKVYLDIDEGEPTFWLRSPRSMQMKQVAIVPGMAVYIGGLPQELILDYGLDEFRLAEVTEDMCLKLVNDRNRDYNVPIRSLCYPSVTLEVRDIRCLNRRYKYLHDSEE
jgi:hypothetical protein